MADLVVPPVGESITEAVVARWLKHVGDTVAADEPVVELETDKITVQVPAPAAGELTEQRAAEGATVKVGDVIGAITAGKAEQPKAAGTTPGTHVAPAEAPAPAGVPAAPAASVPAAPKTAPAAAPKAAPLTSNSPPAGAQPKPIAVQAGSQPVVSPAAAANGESLDKDAILKLTPSQRVEARERGSLGGRGYAPGKFAAEAPHAPSGPSEAERLAAVDPRDQIVPMSPLRKRVAERLVQAQHEAASLTTFNEVDMTAIMDLRAKYKDGFEKAHGAKLGFMSFFVKACIAGAKLFPGINAEIVGGNIVYKKHYDFGIAVSTPKGLVVPVLRDCDALSFAGVEKGIGELADRARNGKLGLADLSGGTFSITNGGIYGSMMSTPLLNYPQTGILGMHNIQKRAVVINDKLEIRPMMYVALSYDHRVVDGREAVSFLVAVKDRLESPDRLLIEA
ncbi:MAG TPA: 2-oxoglutarate dehydrogenase complex dihydrolipoyllysine-residue succinyltransferase [Kofleriaceae bacterium]|jgi:2-oxoglutarate dehydrogenase E2 component (dihydrolipoamide succinyltransferase)